MCGKGLQRIDGQEVFVQPLGKQAKLVICGAGHVATALIHMAKLLNFEIVVLEDRPLFAESARREGADQVFCGDYAELLRQMTGSRDHYFVCMTRGHRFDQECLLEIFKKSHAYIGMMGSKKRSFLMKKELVEARRIHPNIASCLHQFVRIIETTVRSQNTPIYIYYNAK